MSKILDEIITINGDIGKINGALAREMWELDYEMDMEGYRAEGLAEGKKENQKEVVLAAYENGATIEFISKITKLSIKEIEKIISVNVLN